MGGMQRIWTSLGKKKLDRYIATLNETFEMQNDCWIGEDSPKNRDRRRPMVMWEKRAKGCARGLASGIGGINCALALIFDFDETVKKIANYQQLDKRQEEERIKAKELADRLADKLREIEITGTAASDSPIPGYTPAQVIYSLLVKGLMNGVIDKKDVAADCAYGLMRLHVADIKRFNRKSDEERAAGEMRGQDVLQTVRNSGAALYSVFAPLAAFPRHTRLIRIVVDLYLIGAEPRHVDIPDFCWAQRHALLRPFFNELWDFVGRVGWSEEEVCKSMNDVIDRCLLGDPLWCNFPVLIQLADGSFPVGTRQDTIERVSSYLKAKGRPDPMAKRPVKPASLTDAEVEDRRDRAMAFARERLHAAMEHYRQIRYRKHCAKPEHLEYCTSAVEDSVKEVKAAQRWFNAVKDHSPPSTMLAPVTKQTRYVSQTSSTNSRLLQVAAIRAGRAPCYFFVAPLFGAFKQAKAMGVPAAKVAAALGDPETACAVLRDIDHALKKADDLRATDPMHTHHLIIRKLRSSIDLAGQAGINGERLRAARSALATVERRKSGKAARLREDVEEDADRPLKRAKTTSVTVCLRGLPVHVSVDAWSASPAAAEEEAKEAAAAAVVEVEEEAIEEAAADDDEEDNLRRSRRKRSAPSRHDEDEEEAKAAEPKKMRGGKAPEAVVAPPHVPSAGEGGRSNKSKAKAAGPPSGPVVKEAEGYKLRLSSNATGYVGVYRDRVTCRYVARLDRTGHLGMFDTAVEAAVCIAKAHPAAGDDAAVVKEAEGYTLYLSPNSATGYLGVSAPTKSHGYRYAATYADKHLGMFDTAVEAAVAYAKAVQGRKA